MPAPDERIAIITADSFKSSADGSRGRRRWEGVVMLEEALILVGMFAGGAVLGLLSRWGPLSGWAALAFPLVLPPLGFGLTILFC
jgi:hypothetical protein